MHGNRLTRRGFAAALAGAPALLRAQASRPNVILMMTDDQGFGDLSLHGNPILRTPHLDSIGRQGVRFSQFHVNPVCSPTRASLLTGRHYYRTGVVDTFQGRSMMHSDEVTLAESLREAGYRTGLFGKWHLGDHYPLRSIDQGFEESLNCTGGGLTQPSDPPGNTYFDPMLRHNGKWEKHKGYCTDIFFENALRFIEDNHRRPFFTYITPNAPHNPLQVDEELVKPYRAAGAKESTARVYGMVKNVDDNVGRLLAKLDQLRIAENTIVIFLTDNGPQEPRYNAGMRGFKTTVYEGGIRVPFLMRWPKALRAGTEIREFAAHIDVTPTLLELCGAPAPKVPIDGVSLAGLLKGNEKALAPRTLFFQWHRGDRPDPHRNAAVIRGAHKLVNGTELYDLSADPAETRDLSVAQPDLVRRLRTQYDQWFADVSSTRNFAPPAIYLGTENENPVTLTRQDWRSGHWEVEVRKTGRYDVTLRTLQPANGDATLRVGGVTTSQPVKDSKETTFRNLQLGAGPAQLYAEIQQAGGTASANYVEVRRTE